MTSAASASGVADAYNAPNAVASAEVVTITATSVADPTKFVSEQFTVNPKLALVLPAPAVSVAQVGANYTLDLTKFVQGGTAPVSLAISSGTLPAGLTLSAGTISGSPTGPAAVAVVGITASDASKPAMTVSWSVSVSVTAAPGPSITSGSPPNGTVGAFYNPHLVRVCTWIFFHPYCYYRTWYGFSLTASGGISPYVWSWTAASGSSLPPGLTLTNNAINGAPTAAGTYHVIVTVRDSETPPQQASANYTITINP
jgi:hypothetical protein